jgi:uncharacterized protein YkwD
MLTPVRSTLAFALGLWLCLQLMTAPLPAQVGPEIELLARVNRVRAERHLSELRVSNELGAIARAHARDMAEHGYLSHLDPSGRSPLDRVQQAGVSGFALLAENIGASDESGDRLDAIVRAWLASPTHRENLLHPSFNTSGIGIERGTDGRTVAVQLFATF